MQVSAKTEEDDIVQGLRCGADDYVPKPFKRAELAARIRAHIRARDAFQQQQVRRACHRACWGRGRCYPRSVVIQCTQSKEASCACLTKLVLRVWSTLTA